MQFDDFYKTVGMFGPYQKFKYLLICLTYLILPILVYTWTFTAATPSFRCRTALDDISHVTISDDVLNYDIPSEAQCREYKSQISVRECQRCYQMTNKTKTEGPLKECTEFIFDRTYYQSTLVEEWSMVCSGASLRSFVQIIFFVGYMVGSLVFGVLSDRYGRRPIMGISFLIITIAGFICAFAPQQDLGFEISYALFIFGRFLIACASRGIALCGFVIGIEMVGPEKRLLTGIGIQYFFATGELILLGLAFTIRTWRLLHIAIAILSIPFLFFYFVLPESPRWLITKGHYDEAEKILRLIATTNKHRFDSYTYKRLVAEEKKRETLFPEKRHGLIALFKSKVMCILAINMSFQWFVQNLVFYGISQNTGPWLANPYLSFAAAALVEFVAYFVVHLVLDRWGRKVTYCSFVMGFSIVAFLVIPIQMLLIKDTQGQYILMFIVNVILKFFTSGSYAIIYIYASELFPTQARNTGIGFCSTVSRIGAIIGTLSHDALARVWLHLPVVVFSIASLIAIAFAAICPETRNRQIPQTIDDVERTGLAFSLAKSKPLTRVHLDSDEVDENIMLKGQPKDDVF